LKVGSILATALNYSGIDIEGKFSKIIPADEGYRVYINEENIQKAKGKAEDTFFYLSFYENEKNIEEKIYIEYYKEINFISQFILNEFIRIYSDCARYNYIKTNKKDKYSFSSLINISLKTIPISCLNSMKYYCKNKHLQIAQKTSALNFYYMKLNTELFEPSFFQNILPYYNEYIERLCAQTLNSDPLCLLEKE
jgi:hypothetical protein